MHICGGHKYEPQHACGRHMLADGYGGMQHIASNPNNGCIQLDHLTKVTVGSQLYALFAFIVASIFVQVVHWH